MRRAGRIPLVLVPLLLMMRHLLVLLLVLLLLLYGNHLRPALAQLFMARTRLLESKTQRRRLWNGSQSFRGRCTGCNMHRVGGILPQWFPMIALCPQTTIGVRCRSMNGGQWPQIAKPRTAIFRIEADVQNSLLPATIWAFSLLA